MQTALWIRRAQWFMDQCARRFGETFELRIATQGTWLMLSNPAHIEEVFRADPDILYAGEGNTILEPVLGSSSVLVLDGDEHREQRKLMLPAFSGRRIAQYAELMRTVAAEEIDTWPRGETQLLRPRMQALTLEIILRAVMGVTDSARREGGCPGRRGISVAVRV